MAKQNEILIALSRTEIEHCRVMNLTLKILFSDRWDDLSSIE